MTKLGATTPSTAQERGWHLRGGGAAEEIIEEAREYYLDEAAVRGFLDEGGNVDRQLRRGAGRGGVADRR